jgi:hypothetical protein
MNFCLRHHGQSGCEAHPAFIKCSHTSAHQILHCSPSATFRFNFETVRRQPLMKSVQFFSHGRCGWLNSSTEVNGWSFISILHNVFIVIYLSKHTRGVPLLVQNVTGLRKWTLWFRHITNRNSDWLRTKRQTGRSSSPGRIKNCHLSVSSRPALGSIQPPIQWVPGLFFWG